MSGPANFKVTPWRSEPYRRFVASLSCAICGGSNVQAHHEQAKGDGKMGGKCCDSRCLPLCCFHHNLRHAGFGLSVDAEEVILATQSAWLAKGNKALWLAR